MLSTFFHCGHRRFGFLGARSLMLGQCTRASLSDLRHVVHPCTTARNPRALNSPDSSSASMRYCPANTSYPSRSAFADAGHGSKSTCRTGGFGVCFAMLSLPVDHDHGELSSTYPVVVVFNNLS